MAPQLHAKDLQVPGQVVHHQDAAWFLGGRKIRILHRGASITTLSENPPRVINSCPAAAYRTRLSTSWSRVSVVVTMRLLAW